MLAAFFVCITIFPSTSFADTSIKGKTDCPTGSSTVNPAGEKTFGTTDDAAKAIQAYMYSIESCASACFDENVSVKVSVSLTPTVTVTATAKNQCGSTPIAQPSKAQPPRGCASGGIA